MRICNTECILDLKEKTCDVDRKPYIHVSGSSTEHPPPPPPPNLPTLIFPSKQFESMLTSTDS